MCIINLDVFAFPYSWGRFRGFRVTGRFFPAAAFEGGRTIGTAVPARFKVALRDRFFSCLTSATELFLRLVDLRRLGAAAEEAFCCCMSPDSETILLVNCGSVVVRICNVSIVGAMYYLNSVHLIPFVEQPENFKRSY